MNKIKSALLAGGSSLILAANSHAAIITHDFAGAFTFVDDTLLADFAELTPGNFSLASDVSGSIVYDDASLANSGEEFLGVVSFTLNLGDITYTEADDIGFGTPDTTELAFLDGVLQDVLFIAESASTSGITGDPLWEFAISGNVFDYIDLREFGAPPIIASGIIDYNPTVVPVPAAVWLFGSGLIGLVGVARRKNIS